MSTILDTLITDRTQEDVDRASYLNGLWDPRALQWRGTPQERAEWEAGPRGAYGFADMNRVVQAAAYLIGQLEALGYHVDTGDVTPAYNIRVFTDPAGGGVVSGAGVFYEGEMATVAAQAGAKYDFAAWMEAGEVVSTDLVYTFTVERSRNLTAVFALKQFQVSVSVEPPGAGEATGAGTYDIDTEVTVAAVAGDGYAFTRWTENGQTVAEGPEYTFTLDQDRDLKAVMSKTYVISVSANDNDSGTVSGGGTYLDGQTVTVAAVAGNGYEFTGWTENGAVVSTDDVYSFAARADRELVAVFVKTHVITLLVDPAGSGIASGGGTVLEGEQITVTAAAGSGHRFTVWMDGGKQVSADPSYTFTVVEDRTLTAVFEEIPVYTITADIDPAGSGTVTGAGQYQEGASVTLVAVPEDGYKFSGWQENGQTVSADMSYAFTVSANRTLVASFAAKPASRLPDGYTEVEYIQSSGNAGINTGLFGNTLAKTRWVFDAEPLDSINKFLLLGCSYSKSSGGEFNYFELSGSSSYYFAHFGTKIQNITNLLSLNRMTIEFDATSYNTAGTTSTQIIGSVDGNSFEFTASANSNIKNLPVAFIFAANRRTGSVAKIYYAGQGKLYSCKVYNAASAVLRDFVPCINPSGTVGLYDLLEGKFYANKGTGAFTAGPDV